MNAENLMAFVDASPSPYHAVASVARLLSEHGFSQLEGGAPAKRGWETRDGSIVAWHLPDGPITRCHIIAAHTDSPNLRVKPHADYSSSNLSMLALEPYGSPLLNSWLDRDLGLSGRIATIDAGAVETHLMRSDTALARVPQLAIHFDREIASTGLVLNKQRHVNAMWSMDRHMTLNEWIADQIGVAPESVVSHDLMCHDIAPCARIGESQEFLVGPRLDNLCSCFGATQAMASAETPPGVALVMVLCDHEEVGSVSTTGAESAWPIAVMHDLIAHHGAATSASRVLSDSWVLSADMAHATHPNYPELHDPLHHIQMGGGLVIKRNVAQRYATSDTSAARFTAAARTVSVPVQTYAHRADLMCGSTIGPTLAARLGARTVDVGVPQLSMHSCREVIAAQDVDHMCQAFAAWLGA